MEGLAAQLADVGHLTRMHWDAPAQQFRDWGNHTEAVRLQWVQWTTPDGRPAKTALVRVVGDPAPSPQFVPHFGCASAPLGLPCMHMRVHPCAVVPEGPAQDATCDQALVSL